MAEGVATFAGFGIATMLIMDGDMSECVAVAGEEQPSGVLGSRAPSRFLREALEASEHWGPLRFLSHENLDPAAIAHAIVPDLPVSDDPEDWHPLNSLVLPICDREGNLRAALAIDAPLDGRIPNSEQRRQLENYSIHARRAILTTLDREKLAERIAVSGAARRVVRAASGALSLAEVLEKSKAALLEGFAADELWWQLLTVPASLQPLLDSLEIDKPPGLHERTPDLARAVAQQAWRDQSVIVARAGQGIHAPEAYEPEILQAAEEFLARDETGSLLVIPLGAGEDCLGMVVLHRRDGSGWTTVETEEALDVGHDLGRALLNAHNYEGELAQVRRLQAMDTYKSQLISTVSHELRTPLTSIVGNLEILQELISDADLDPMLARAAAATDRGAQRLGAIVEDLLLLSRVTDPNASMSRERVDLGEIVADVLALHSTTARQQGIEVVVASASEPVILLGVASELDRVVVNLVSNAVKYSPSGSTVRVSMENIGKEAVLVVADDGYGISQADQKKLFREFFRSNNPKTIQVRGTGLGLAIVQRIVDRHGGRIELSSQLGVGSEFRVYLPRAKG
ncbi:hypothetical protein GCM10027020_31200 [Nocardioides salsibiostraticola]